MEKGDFVEIDYVAKLAGTSTVFDTTMEDEAKTNDIYKETFTYEPIRTVVGAEYVVEGMDEALLTMKVGEQGTVEVPPEKGYGKRNPKLIVKVPLKEFRKHKVMPRPGLRMEINGRWAVVRNVTSGRVSLDFNHFLAGKTVIYDLTINRKIDDLDEKITTLIKLTIGTELAYSQEEKTLRVKEKKDTEDELKENFLNAVKEYLPEIDSAEFVKEFPKKEKKDA
jgi:FKBP-type peptidyl-prolyl cis-trans isomerase 2